MTHAISFLNQRTSREYGVFFFIVSAAVLSTVFISQKFGFHPCELCIWQRWPYALTGLLSLALIVVGNNSKASKMLLVLLGVVFFASAGLGLFHLGVENKWWEFKSGCTGNAYSDTKASVEDFLANLKKEPSVKCDQKMPFLFGMTMPFYNLLTSLFMSFLAFFAVYSLRSNSLSQYK